jgi:DNA-directed RNA polymerase
MIHDSYGTHAGCADQLQYELRRAFVDIYKQPVMKNFRDDVLSQLPEGTVLPEVPVMGGLKVDEILESEYMFS